MEGAGDEPLSPHVAVPEAADGDIWLAAHVVGVLSHGVFLSSGIGCYPAYALVGGDAVCDLAGFPHPCQVDSRIAHSAGCRHHHEYGSGLLGLLPETAWSFLCCCHRRHARCSCCVDLPTAARKILSASHLYIYMYGCALSAHRLLWSFGGAADGGVGLEIGETNADGACDSLGGSCFVHRVLASVLLQLRVLPDWYS